MIPPVTTEKKGKLLLNRPAQNKHLKRKSASSLDDKWFKTTYTVLDACKDLHIFLRKGEVKQNLFVVLF